MSNTTHTPAAPGRPEGGRLRADAARNRLKVLEAARIAFAETGHDAQMSDIARRAGVGVGTVYRHFPTKESLAQAIVEHRFQQVVLFLRTEVLPDPDPWNGIVRSFEYCATMQELDRGHIETVTVMVGGNKFDERAIAELNELTETVLRRAQAEGSVRPDLTAADMSPLYIGLAQVVLAGVIDWRRYLDILLDGIRPRRDGCSETRGQS
ncbi:TetR/AcrR family transcriptional regulator [Streptomyces sp. NBC_01314]|uniref:TetR/AcrR family transcriptional regulator n=1 Tax=Streptomyces sp. NBC_01314 TaxID=2903821 RepID=UPI0030895910|nr:TetR/AcrR family transcriptional regulator [Streptomyces sp. NBC_01314]